MKITRLLSISILLSVFFSCSHGFLKDPRLYNPKRTTVQTVAPEPELQLTGGVDPFDKIGEWYNNPDSNGDATNPETEGFAAEEFNQIQIAGWFSDKNVPTYTMTKGDVWKEGDATKREYVHSNAPSTEGQGWSITGVTYYQYRGINPNYEATGNYNVSLQTTKEGKPKLNRFYFYRFTGKGGGVQWLDNYLIAVDTYSKLIFAFSEPVEFSSMGAPTKWDPTDNDAFSDDIVYQFYMYDPVGYVLKDGEKYTVQLYEWFEQSIASGNYKANIQGFQEIAEKNPKKPGKSPFNNHLYNFFVDNIKLLANKDFMHRPPEGEHVNGTWLYHMITDGNGETFVETKEQYGTNATAQGRIFTYKSSKTATEGIFLDKEQNEWTLFLEEECTKLVFKRTDGSDEFTRTLGDDPGPSWLIRVKGKIFEGSGYTYTFSEDGKSISLSNGKEYTYAQQDANDRAVYRAYAGGYFGTMISENDTKITWTPTPYLTASTTPSSWATSSPAWIKISVPDDPKFYDYVKGGIYSYREEDEKGYGLIKHSYIFDSTGKSVTYSKAEWGGSKTDEVLSYSTENDITRASYSGKEFILGDNGYKLIVNGVEYYKNYDDRGPSFINRVKGKTFVEKGKTEETGYSYTFTDDGTVCYYKNPNAGWFETKEATYTYIGAEKRESLYEISAAYNGPWQFGAFGTVWGLKLTDNDTTVAGSTSATTGSDILTSSDTFTGKPANLYTK